jgi:hypothetical protein
MSTRERRRILSSKGGLSPFHYLLADCTTYFVHILGH